MNKGGELRHYRENRLWPLGTVRPIGELNLQDDAITTCSLVPARMRLGVLFQEDLTRTKC